MTIREARLWATKLLTEKKIGSPAPDAEILLAFAIKKSKEYLLAHPELELTNSQLKTYKLITYRRSRREPVAYIIGHKDFFGVGFSVNKNVLIPRPETELLVENALQFAMKHKPTLIIDVGTGSGCIAIAMAKNLSRAKIIATDTSARTLKLARQNARNNGVASQTSFLRGNLLEPLLKSKKFILHNSKFIILSNLPYLTTAEWEKTELELKKYEPRTALDGGPDGLKYFRKFFEQLNMFKSKPQAIFLEIGWNQADKIMKLAKKYLPEYNTIIKKDLAGFDRIVIMIN